MRGPVDQLPSWNDPPADPARLHPERLAEMASEDPSLRDQQQAVGELLMSGVRWCPVPSRVGNRRCRPSVELGTCP